MTKSGRPRNGETEKGKAPRDVPDPRTKGTKRGKTTADK
jgi:hypothetical protein